VNKCGSDLPDVGTDYADALKDGKEDRSFEISCSGQADGHEGASGAEVVNGLGVTRGACGSNDGGMSTESAGDSFYVRNEVLSLFEVYPSLGTEAENQVLLIFAGILSQRAINKVSPGGKRKGGKQRVSPTDSDNTKTPGNGILNGKMSESSTGTWDDNPITLLCLGELDGAIYGDTLNHVKLVSRLDKVVVTRRPTAQRTEAASELGNPSGMGVTSGSSRSEACIGHILVGITYG
jgi:hypothetical protein